VSSTERGPNLQKVVSEFPAMKLDELVAPVGQEELADVANDGESKNWKRTVFDVNRGEMKMDLKTAGDNSVRFVIYPGGPDHTMLGVQQSNAQAQATEIWEYREQAGGDQPENWNQHLLPELKLNDFFDERVKLPARFDNQPAKPYLNYELIPGSVNITLNRWSLLHDAENELDPTLVKYKYVFHWSGSDFNEQKVKEAGYNDVLTFTSRVIEPDPGGPGPHEFDCGHGVSVKTSSTLPKQGKSTYDASNMVDNGDRSEATAWSEGVAGGGVGEWIEFTITSGYYIGSSWQIGNGYTRNKEIWQANNRVKKMAVTVDEKLIGYVMLANVSTIQSFDIAPNWLKDAPAFKKGTKIRFTIEEIYKGSKYDDTLISYFVPVGNCG
jgi:hypothetical protein